MTWARLTFGTRAYGYQLEMHVRKGEVLVVVFSVQRRFLRTQALFPAFQMLELYEALRFIPDDLVLLS